MVSDTRLYGAAIGVVSGGYSLWSASTATAMGTGGWLMALLGVVVLVHGVVLLTDYADRLGDASGPLMIGYSVLMLLNQALVGTGMAGGMGSGMNGGMGGGSMSGTAGSMGWDAGMVALAVLMLLSGVIMTQRTADDGRM
ncbi:hypothetical protein SY89_02763 [Halolamina pelagica]|uniref:Uncharacterized protein n=1 Tax=Halolamina pelagica TaxID=699431 RepID=A0A0P7H130_9EURY|nr:hypothetical protein [Halolamina pelagica]KPN32006.1 hypothetical protein SY89_02763 [Halolamina pelagica]